MAFLIIVAAVFAMLVGVAALYSGQHFHAAALFASGLAISMAGFDAFG
jgi:hypothetical protein